MKATANEKRKLSDGTAPNAKEQESKKFKTSSLFDNGSNDPSGEQVLVIQQLKDEIVGLQKQLSQKDNVILERDKRIAALSAESMRSEKDYRAKMADAQKSNQETHEALQEKIRSLSKQVAQLSRGKRVPVVFNGNGSPSAAAAATSS
uniref:Uncharacterized protein n=1 Tax=Plectus sambesii TaxID=2011161 RepID=A0A914VDI0_9BILA